MGSELDVKIFLKGPATRVEEGVATPLIGAFHHHFLKSFSNRFLREATGRATDESNSSDQ